MTPSAGGDGGDDREPLDGPLPDPGREPADTNREPADANREPPNTDREPSDPRGDNDVFVRAAPSGELASLAARLDARFAALEAQFAAFEVRAENGFGMFAGSGDEASTGGQGGAIVLASTSPRSVTMTQRIDNAGNDKSHGAVSKKAGKDGKSDRVKAREKGKGDRHNRHKGK